MFQRKKYVSVLVLCCLASSAWTQTVPEEYSKQIAYRSKVGALTDTFVGDRIDLGTGSLEIIQTDVDLPGKNALPVRVGRRFLAADAYGGGHFGNWTLDIPNIHGTFAYANGWIAGDFTSNRCSSYSAPPTVSYQGGDWDPDEYWHGTFFYLPGSGDQELLQGGGHKPTDGSIYRATTKEGAAARCVPLAPTSVSGSQGDGFEVVTRDGMVYTLNQMVARYRVGLKKLSGAPALAAATIGGQTQSIAVQPMAPVGYILPRHDSILFPTKITDRFGNTVVYNWSTTNPWQLLSMVASDGRHLDFTYVAFDSEKIATVSDGARVWQYAYGGVGGIDVFTLPDGTAWLNDLTRLRNMAASPTNVSCAAVNSTTARTTYTSAGNAIYTGSITGPSGATVTFAMSDILLGRSYATYNCISEDDNPVHARPEDPYLFVSGAVVGKKITGPGLPTNGLNWSYAYGPTNNCWAGTYSQGVACTDTSPTTRSVLVTGPDSVVTRYTFGNRVRVDEGLLYKTEYGWDGTQAKRTVQIDYIDPTTIPGSNYGWSPRSTGDALVAGRIHPQGKVTTTQQGRVFTWAVASDCNGASYCFDSYARPTKVVKNSAPSP